MGFGFEEEPDSAALKRVGDFNLCVYAYDEIVQGVACCWGKGFKCFVHQPIVFYGASCGEFVYDLVTKDLKGEKFLVIFLIALWEDGKRIWPLGVRPGK